MYYNKKRYDNVTSETNDTNYNKKDNDLYCVILKINTKITSTGSKKRMHLLIR